MTSMMNVSITRKSPAQCQGLPLRGSWQSRKALTERVRALPSRRKAALGAGIRGALGLPGLGAGLVVAVADDGLPPHDADKDARSSTTGTKFWFMAASISWSMLVVTVTAL